MGEYLETPRLVLRRFTPEDVDNVWELDSDPEVMRHLTGGQPTPYDDTRDLAIPRFLAYHQEHEGLGYWAAEERATGEFIGRFHLKRDRSDHASLEVGYRLKRSVWGQGYATDAVRALVRKAFEDLDAPRVTAYTTTENGASWRVMEKAGLSFVRAFVLEAPGRWHHGREAVEYALSRQEWESGSGRGLLEPQGS
jgi:RimJ/RimL family protein N-acetyltransferase